MIYPYTEEIDGDQFTITSKLGEGTHGVVMAATLKDGTKVALKKVKATDDQIPSEVIIEIMCYKLLTNGTIPHIVNVKGVKSCLITNSIYLVMDVYDMNLSEYIKAYGTCVRCLVYDSVFNQCMMMLSYLKRYRILHRDISPNNIFIKFDQDPQPFLRPRCYLGDFGLAWHVPRKIDTPMYPAYYIPCYRPPEIWMEMPYSHSSDVWAMGMLLLEYMIGYCPIDLTTSSDTSSSDDGLSWDSRHIDIYHDSLSQITKDGHIDLVSLCSKENITPDRRLESMLTIDSYSRAYKRYRCESIISGKLKVPLTIDIIETTIISRLMSKCRSYSTKPLVTVCALDIMSRYIGSKTIDNVDDVVDGSLFLAFKLFKESYKLLETTKELDILRSLNYDLYRDGILVLVHSLSRRHNHYLSISNTYKRLNSSGVKNASYIEIVSVLES